jgi:hypothetical protein
MHGFGQLYLFLEVDNGNGLWLFMDCGHLYL